MHHETRRRRDINWTSLPALPQVERLEAACHRVMLPAGGEEARNVLRHMLPLDLGAGLDPGSAAASAARTAAAQMADLLALLDENHPEPLALRVGAARFCQTLATMRGHLSGGRRLRAAASRGQTDVAI